MHFWSFQSLDNQIWEISKIHRSVGSLGGNVMIGSKLLMVTHNKVKINGLNVLINFVYYCWWKLIPLKVTWTHSIRLGDLSDSISCQLEIMRRQFKWKRFVPTTTNWGNFRSFIRRIETEIGTSEESWWWTTGLCVAWFAACKLWSCF